jgi:hypothetical protein
MSNTLEAPLRRSSGYALSDRRATPKWRRNRLKRLDSDSEMASGLGLMAEAASAGGPCPKPLSPNVAA